MLAIDLGLQMNYNSEVQMLTEMEDGSFIMTTKDGRVNALPELSSPYRSGLLLC